ncbi:polymeric immunoglobulin receptor-like isoform X3 [Sphaeramia orbicularis]|uniref:polymeric immunoglobulin receptor-like isoform X3 n=1 Tax=Sphaeramia orbicularis TaxID=375764 RepID=UPI00117E9B58|nr:polymeric immunoglobulin receptor-like isoform X3 [Sphaeramia orbicularis]
MAIFVGIFLILPGLTGIHSISTVSYVTVEKGGSISIPCFYESKYTDNEKYLCKGCKWKICSYEVKTNQYNSTKYLISDDQNQGVVTWTINDLTEEDTDCYWCVMEINHRPDNGKCFNVRVTGKGDATLYVDSQKVTGFIGDQITIDCHYRGSKQIKWCRTGVKGPTSCIKDSGKIDETMVTIMRNTPGVITVTMSELRERSSGWYWCTDEDLQMPVHVTIKERPTTTTIATTTTTRTRQSMTISSTSKPVNHTYVSQEPTTEQTGTHSSSSNHLLSFIIPLCLLLLIVTVAVLTWFMLKRRKSPATAEDEQTVTYSTVTHVRKNTAQINTEDEADVMYSTVFCIAQQNTHQVEDKDENVTYSTVVRH